MTAINLNHIDASALPNEIRELVAALIEGTVKTLIVIAEIQGDSFMDAVYVDMDGGTSNRLATLGAIEVVKRDFMREEIESTREYIGHDDIVCDDGAEDDPKINN